MSMSDHLLLWETWHRWHGDRSHLASPVSEIDHILDSQRRFQAMLADGDIFYSRTDLRMMIDKAKTDARLRILEAFNQQHNGNHAEEACEELVLHAAAKIMVAPLNMMQLIKDYPELVAARYPRPEGPTGALPLHYAAAAVGSNHAERLKPLLNTFPGAVKQVDGLGLLPMQVALIHGAGLDVILPLIEAYPPALEMPLLPLSPIPEDLESLVGLLPIHIACCCNYSLDVIFSLLLECPDSILGANDLEGSLEMLKL